MLFNLKKLTAEQLQKDNADLYNAIFSLGVAQGEKQAAEKATAEGEKVEKDKVLSFASENGLKTEAEDLFAKGQTTEQVAEQINKSVTAKTEKSKAEKEKELKAFQEAAPQAAGAASSSELEVDVKTWDDAVKFVQKRDGITKAEATRKASSEFVEIHRKTFNIGKK